MTEKPAETATAIHPLLARRWSPRAFADRAIEEGDLLAMLEAARWAPSSRNEQPWRFIVARRHADPQLFARIRDCLAEGNRVWAADAAVLLVAVSSTRFAYKDRPNGHAGHDVGQAMALLTVEAMAHELWVHQMGGFDRDCVRVAFGVPDGFEPITAAAIGHMGDPADLPSPLDEREAAPRNRRPLSESVFGGMWGEAAPLLSEAAAAKTEDRGTPAG
jgi:nitroreductase